MPSGITTANEDFTFELGLGNDLVLKQDGVEKARAGSGGFGKVLQVVETSIVSTFTSSSTTLVDTDITGNITPILSTSKIKVLIVFPCAKNDGNADDKFTGALYRDGIDISGEITMLYEKSTDNIRGLGIFSQLDSPATISQVTYTVKARANAGTITTSGNKATIILEEIGA